MRFHRRRPPITSSPGSLAVEPSSPPPRIRVVTYNAAHLVERDITVVDEVPSESEEGLVTWIDVQGLGDATALEHLARIFGLHRLAVADVVNVPQRPKVESYDTHLFVVTRKARLGTEAHLETEQVSLFLGRSWVLTFQEGHGDVLGPLRERLRLARGQIRHLGADYLSYAAIDVIVDGYFPVLEELGERLAHLEDEALDAPRKRTLQQVIGVRNDLLVMRRIVWPQRDALNALLRDGSPLVSDVVGVYLRDVHDHCLQIADVIESYREVVGSVTSTYLSSVSNRMNEVMKVLTIMASIFIPLTFMAGIYGMNFEFMPELHFRYAYPVLWLAMAAVGGGLVLYFYRRGWLSSKDDE